MLIYRYFAKIFWNADSYKFYVLKMSYYLWLKKSCRKKSVENEYICILVN